MFKKSRRKIILSIMGSLILLFAITSAVVWLASYHEIKQKNLDMLERYVDIYSLEHPPGSEGDLLADKGPF